MSHVDESGIVLASRELREYGLGWRHRSALLRSGDWRVLRHGACQLTEAGGYQDKQHRLLVLATADQTRAGNAVFSHASAAVMWGLPVWGVDLSKVHLTRDGRAGCSSSELTVPHRSRLLDGELDSIEGVPITSLARTVLDVARYHGVERGVVVADAALRGGLRPQDLKDSLDLMIERRSAGCARTVVEFADPAAESVGESRSRVVLAAIGLPTPVLQQEFHDASQAFIARTDFWFRDFRTIGEFDGLTKYGLDPQSPIEALAREKAREDRLRDLGFQVVRWTFGEISQHRLLLDRFRRAFARAGHPSWQPRPRRDLLRPGTASRRRT